MRIIAVAVFALLIAPDATTQNPPELEVTAIILESYQLTIRSDDDQVNLTIGGSVLAISVPPGPYAVNVLKANDDSETYAIDATVDGEQRVLLADARYDTEQRIVVPVGATSIQLRPL